MAQSGYRAFLLLGALAHARERAASQLYQGCGFSAFGVEPMALKLGSGYLAKIHMWRALG